MPNENVVEDELIELELEVPEDEVDPRAADLDANAVDQLSLAPTVEADEEVSAEAQVKEYLESDPKLQEYGDGVQKRINKLTYQREEAKRREDAAVQYAQQVKQELQTYQQQQSQVNVQRDTQLQTEYGNRINAELDTAKQRYKDAFESGDADLIVEANRELSALAVEQDSIKRRAPRTEAKQVPAFNAQTQQYYAQQQQQQQQQQRPQPAAPDGRATDWASANEWFGEDEAMTHAALGYHRKLVEEEYLDPQSDDYYGKINTYMKSNFPHKFVDNSENSSKVVSNGPVQTVAGAGRSAGVKSGRKVKLTQSQVAIANRLGVPLKEYAKYVQE